VLLPPPARATGLPARDSRRYRRAPLGTEISTYSSTGSPSTVTSYGPGFCGVTFLVFSSPRSLHAWVILTGDLVSGVSCTQQKSYVIPRSDPLVHNLSE
jgi:hypothetical protein